jgi:hypothetical protein
MTTVHVSPGILETEGSMSQRMIAFTNEFAAKTCPKGFNFIADPSPDLRVNALTQRDKIYTFRSRNHDKNPSSAFLGPVEGHW